MRTMKTMVQLAILGILAGCASTDTASAKSETTQTNQSNSPTPSETDNKVQALDEVIEDIELPELPDMPHAQDSNMGEQGDQTKPNLAEIPENLDRALPTPEQDLISQALSKGKPDADPHCANPLYKGTCLLREFDLDGYARSVNEKEAKAFLANSTLYTDKTSRTVKKDEAQAQDDSMAFDTLSFLVENHNKLQTLSAGMLAESVGTLTGIGLLQKVLSGGSERRKGLFRTLVFAYPEAELQARQKTIYEAGIEDFTQYLDALNIVESVEFSKELPGGYFNAPRYGFKVTGSICQLALQDKVDECTIANEFFSGDADVGRSVIDGVPTVHAEVRFFRFGFLDHRAMDYFKTEPYFYVGMLYGLTNKMSGHAYLFEPKIYDHEVGFIYDGRHFFPITKD